MSIPGEIPTNGAIMIEMGEPEFVSDALTNRDVRLTVFLELLRKYNNYPTPEQIKVAMDDTKDIEEFINSVDDQTEGEG